MCIRDSIEADALAARATVVKSSADAMIARQKLEIEKLRRELFGARSERKARLLDQLEMQLEDFEANATADEVAAQQAPRATTVKSFDRRRPSRKPFPKHLPRERVVIAAPESCPCYGSTRLSKLGEDVSETLERDPTAVEGHPDDARKVLVPASARRSASRRRRSTSRLAASLARTYLPWCCSRSSASTSR